MDFNQNLKELQEKREAKEIALRLKGITKVETIRAGQARSYQDSIYEYKIEATAPESEVKEICLTEIHKCNPENKGSDFSGHCCFTFGLNSFYSFSKNNDGSYTYKVCSPFCD